jgi:glutaredoxin
MPRMIVAALLLLYATAASAQVVPAQTGKETKKYPEVIFYSASWCGICKRARNYFNSRQIPFTEYDVEKTRKGMDNFRLYRARGVPLIFVDGKRMDGFSVARFRQIYRPVQ